MLPAFTVFDVETTGLDPRQGHRILEIAGVRVEPFDSAQGRGWKIMEEQTFSQLVNPERPIPWEAKSINKITDEEVRTAPTIDAVLPAFLRFAENSVLVAHNAEFDMGFLRQEKECCWGYIELPESFCTMKLSQSLFPHEFRHNLDVVSLRLGLNIPAQRHRALPDVLVTAQALLKMLETGKIQTIEELRKRAGIRQLVT
ncbi:MAG: 3'-5' exonuclease [Candidatus Peribacteraceae bacterium]|jgi:DNA polymerase-3 subunit epsilon|nr:3'-5' exonuclease [Candidatus Peribacteraceae bacterium]